LFRGDLYFRLNVVRLAIPPLRERRQDIAQLFASFAGEAMAQTGQGGFRITEPVRRHLVRHDWPGNVRELRNYAFGAVLGLHEASPETESGGESLAARVARYEELLIREALASAQGNVTRALAALDVPRKTLYDKMRRAGISASDYRGKR